MYQALYRKYRPKTLEEICGQTTIVKIINNAIEKQKVSHAYLFCGPRGTGKTSIAKIFAKMVNCEAETGKPCGKCNVCKETNNQDVIEIDAASNNGVDEIRELKNKISLVPTIGKYKVYIIDEVHMLTTGAFNALLKTLEEPPEHIIFVLATTDPHKIPETILSRCQRFDFKRIESSQIYKRLKQISEIENINITDDAINTIAQACDGGMRDSIGLLDQISSYKDEITEEDVHEINGTITIEEQKEIIMNIINKNTAELLKITDKYSENGKNFQKIVENLLVFLKNLLICQKAPKYFEETNGNVKKYQEIVKNISSKSILEIIDNINKCSDNIKTSSNQKLAFEIMLIKIIELSDNTSEEPIIRKQEKKIETKPITSPVGVASKEEIKIEKQPENRTEPKTEKTVEKKEKKSIKNDKIIEEIKEIRINNTLARFNKRKMLEIAKSVPILDEHLLDTEYSQYISMILDGTLKAASEENLIFVYKTERLSKIFNQNIINIEETLKKYLNTEFKVISASQKEWDIIKNEFNTHSKVYEYQKETLDLKNLEEEPKSKLDEFSEIIEYK